MIVYEFYSKIPSSLSFRINIQNSDHVVDLNEGRLALLGERDI